MGIHLVKKNRETLLEELIEYAVPSQQLVSLERALKTLEAMYLARFMDDKMGKLVRQNKGATFHGIQ